MIRDEWDKHALLVGLGTAAIALVASVLILPSAITTPLSDDAAAFSDVSDGIWIAAGSFGTLGPVFGIIVGAIVFAREFQWNTYTNLAILYSPSRIVVGKLAYGLIIAAALTALAAALGLGAAAILGIRGLNSTAPGEIYSALGMVIATPFVGFMFWFTIAGGVAYLLRSSVLSIFIVLGGAYAEAALAPSFFGDAYSASLTPLNVQLSSIENLRHFANSVLAQGTESPSFDPLASIMVIAYVVAIGALTLFVARYRAPSS